MKQIFGTDQLKLERRVVDESGNGQLRADMYLFDQVRIEAPGIVGERQSIAAFLGRVRDVGTVIAILDRAPDSL